MAKAKDEPVKIGGKTIAEIFGPKKSKEQTEEEYKAGHAAVHSANAFCGFAGPEEMKHYGWLMSKLTDKQVRELCEKVGIKSIGLPDDRDILESWIEEADREIFYCEYHKLIKYLTPKY